MATAVDFLVEHGLHPTLLAGGIGHLEVCAPERSWVVGPRPSTTQAAALRASEFELFQALTGRRSAGQMARLEWTADPAPFLPAFRFGTFTTSTVDLVE